MAIFTFVTDKGLTKADPNLDKAAIADMVAQAAVGVSWNLLGNAKNFGTAQVDIGGGRSQVQNIHAKSGVEFKAGFQMYETEGAQKWEGHAVHGTYRLDLQNIEGGWANWSVQTNGSNSKTVAKCMMQVGGCFGQGQLIHALNQSARQKKSCELTHGTT